MLKKRLIGVITVRDGWAVQSFGYRRHLPLGHVEPLAENLDRWGVDEILIQCIDRDGRGPDLELLRRLGRLGLATPLVFAGGIAAADQAVAAVQAGADRVCLDAVLGRDGDAVRAISAALGAQAVIAALPLSCGDGNLLRLDYRSGREAPLSTLILDLFTEGVVSEALVIDWRHEGSPESFDAELLRRFPVRGVPLIAFGGISEAAQIGRLLTLPGVAAVGVGNFLSYREHAVQKLREGLDTRFVRPAEYA